MSLREKNTQPSPFVPSPMSGAAPQPETPMSTDARQTAKEKSPWRAFWDFFVLFSGISTKSNLSRTRKEPVLSRGLFLFRARRRGQPR